MGVTDTLLLYHLPAGGQPGWHLEFDSTHNPDLDCAWEFSFEELIAPDLYPLGELGEMEPSQSLAQTGQENEGSEW